MVGLFQPSSSSVQLKPSPQQHSLLKQCPSLGLAQKSWTVGGQLGQDELQLRQDKGWKSLMMDG